MLQSRGSTEALPIVEWSMAPSQIINAWQSTSSISIEAGCDPSGNQTQTAAQGYNGLVVCDMAEGGNVILPWGNISSGITIASMMKCRACYLMKL